LALACFGVVACGGLALAASLADYGVAAVLLLILAVTAAVDVVVIQRRRAARRRQDSTKHSLFE